MVMTSSNPECRMTPRTFLFAASGISSLALLGTARPTHKDRTVTGTTMQPHTTTGSDAIRPFRISIPEADLVDLRRRITATRWPQKETVSDRSQGVQLARLQALVEYWGTKYDWRKVALSKWWNHSIVGRNQVPAWLRSPGELRHRPVQCLKVYGTWASAMKAAV